MNEHFKNVWCYRFGLENPTGGIIYAETYEEAMQKLENTYGRDFRSPWVVLRHFNEFEKTSNPDVKEIYSL